MNKIYAIGETVLDIIFKKGKVKEAVPGGSMLNAAVSMSRAGLDVALITETGSDKTAEIATSFLKENGVDCSYIFSKKETNTPVALAFLDDNNDAAYQFYRDRGKARPGLKIPPVGANDILLFGSYYSLSARTRDAVREIVIEAKSKGATIIYDLNFRSPHASELPSLLPVIRENARLSHIVRGSGEDLMTIFQDASLKPLRDFAGDFAVLVITHASMPVKIDSPRFSACFPVDSIETLSTIGAGDSFNAGMIYGIVDAGADSGGISKLGRGEWERITGFAAAFAADVCTSYGNYISHGFAARFKGKQPL